MKLFEGIKKVLRALAIPVERHPAFFLVSAAMFCPTVLSQLFHIIPGPSTPLLKAVVIACVISIISIGIFYFNKKSKDYPHPLVTKAVLAISAIAIVLYSLTCGIGGTLMLFWAYVLTCLVCLIRWKVVKYIMYALAFAFFLVNIFVYTNFDTTISPTVLTLMAETNSHEASDFFSTFLMTDESLYAFAVSFIVLLVLVLAEWGNKKLSSCAGAMPLLMGVLVLLVLARSGIDMSKMYPGLLRCETPDDVHIWMKYTDAHPVVTAHELIHSLYSVHLASSTTRKAIEMTKAAAQEDVTCEFTDTLHLVVVIGESYNKYHSPLYGYPLATTPMMSKEAAEGRLFIFKDVVAPYNLTSEVIKNLFCCNDLSEGEHWYEHPSFPAIFKKAGYEVALWDNQRDSEKTKTFSFALNSFLFDHQLSQLSYDDLNEKTYTYDGAIVDDYFKNHKKEGRLNLVMLHLNGQHFDSKARYPKESLFTVFNPDSVRRDEPFVDKRVKWDIAYYDNATLYNDYVMRKIFDHYRESNALVVYFSDHGAEIFDVRDYKGRHQGEHIDPMSIKYQFEVPFVIWMSDKYRQAHPEIANLLPDALDRPFMLDNTCHILFHLGGIHTKHYNAARDALSPQFKVKKRLLRGHIPYEDMMKGL